MSSRIQRDWHSHKLLEGMQNGIALWKGLVVSYIIVTYVIYHTIQQFHF